MGLNFAIDELYSTGWAALDSSGCEHHADGRAFPRAARIGQEFRSAGFDLGVRYIQLFDCYRAEWRDSTGQPCGAVVGQTEEEAAVYALAQMRRQTHLAAVGS